MRRELADFIGARSEAGCKKAECRAATYPVTQHMRKPSQTGGVHVDGPVMGDGAVARVGNFSVVRAELLCFLLKAMQYV